jgi:hypothetical protein
MRILFDQGTPVPLRALLPGHVVATVYELGWSQLQNGELIRQAELAGYEAFVTTDQSLRYQQQLAGQGFFGDSCSLTSAKLRLLAARRPPPITARIQPISRRR